MDEGESSAALQGGGSSLPLLTLSSDLLLTSCLVDFEMLPLKRLQNSQSIKKAQVGGREMA